jgi:hypothetical protein
MTMTPVARATDPRIAGIAKNVKYFFYPQNLRVHSSTIYGTAAFLG